MMKAMIHIVPLQRENGLRKRAKATEMTTSNMNALSSES